MDGSWIAKERVVPQEVRKESTSTDEMISKKLDESFLTSQFVIPGFSEPFRLDRNRFGGGLFLYVRENTPSKLLRCKNFYEAFLVELNIKKQKWLVICSYNPHLPNINTHLQRLQSSIDMVESKYEKILFLGDFNCEVNKFDMPEFCENLGLRSLITSPTCYNKTRKYEIHYLRTNISMSSLIIGLNYTIVSGVERKWIPLYRYIEIGLNKNKIKQSKRNL